MTLPFDESNLDKLAKVIVKTGLNLSPGQDVIITASAEALPLLRRVTVEAYKAGAGLVTAMLGDEEMTRARYQHGSD
ncbi:MAG: aminopeptidase, partial [Paracoccaceae bacterium]